MSMMTRQNKVTIAEVPCAFPVTDQSTANHGKVQVSCIQYRLQIKSVGTSLLDPAVLCSDSLQHGNVSFVFFTAAKEEKPESKDLLADLQDISDSERKTSTAESSMGN